MRFRLTEAPFAGQTGRGIVVAVLDSGIHAGHAHVGAVERGISFVTDDVNDSVDRIGHGTAVAAAIRQKAPDVSLIAVKVFDRQLSTSADILARAIVWAADAGAHIINLSLGTANAARADVFADAILDAAARGAVLVSAREANGVEWYPGSLPGVVGVSADESLEREEMDVVQRPDGSLFWRAAPYPRPIPGVPRERNLSGVSFAVANVTGFLALAARETVERIACAARATVYPE